MSGRYLGRKVVQAVFTILAIVVLNFLLFRMMPGSPERILLRPAVTLPVEMYTSARIQEFDAAEAELARAQAGRRKR